MKAIAIPTNDRPKLLQRCVASVQTAIGFSNWMIFACPESEPKRGCRRNTHEACQHAIDCGSHWVLYLEDDVIISPDALILCDAFIDSGKPGILCLRRWHDSQTPNHDLISPANHGLLGDGFLFPATLWPFLSEWWFRDEPAMGGKMWDWSVSYGLDKQGILQWRPLVNRSKNIGTHGTHSTDGGDLNHFGECYQGEPVKQFRFEP